MTKPVVLITGCSSGIGLSTTVHLAKNGYQVVASMRNLEKALRLEKALEKAGVEAAIVSLDVNDPDSIRSALRFVMDEYGRLDALVNNAGITIDAFFEDHSEEDVEKIFKTNVFGVFNVTRQVLPIMRSQRSGRIINIGSVVGQFALPQVGVYSSTKFALEGFTEALRYEVKPFGIHVSIVEPCFIETELFEANRNVGTHSNTAQSAYTQFNQQFEEHYDEYGKKYSKQPEAVAKLIHKVLTTKKPLLRYMMGARETSLHFLKRFLPRGLYERVYNWSFPTLSDK